MTPSVCACPTPGSCAPPRLLPTSTWTRPSRRCASSGPGNPAGVALAHYGLLPEPLDMLEEAEGILRRWAEVAETAWRAGEDIATALDRRLRRRTR